MATVLRYLALFMGAVAILGSVLPGTRVQSGRFSQGPGLPMPRAGRIMMLIFGLVLVGLGLSCGRA